MTVRLAVHPALRIGLAAAILHLIVRGEHRVGPTSAFALGIAGASAGALFAAAFVRGGWANFPPFALLGAAVGAIGSIVAMELCAEAYVRGEERARS